MDLTFKVNYAVAGMHAAAFRAVNIGIHIACALLLHGLVLTVLRSPRLRAQWAGRAAWFAAAVALVWVLHPLHTQSVGYISQRYECLMALFFLLTLYCFARALSAPRPRPWVDGALVACALGMTAKEVMVAAPPLLLLFDWTFGGGRVRDRWRWHLAFFATEGILCVLWLGTMAGVLAVGAQVVSEVSPARYLATQMQIILHYVRLAFWPYPLCFDYAWEPVAGMGEVLLPGALVAGLGVLSVAALLRRRPAGFLGAAFFAILAPTSSALPVPDMAAEHRMYLPLAAVAVAAVGLAYNILHRVEIRFHLSALCASGVRGVALLAGCCLLGTLTVQRNRDYRDEVALWGQCRLRPSAEPEGPCWLGDGLHGGGTGWGGRAGNWAGHREVAGRFGVGNAPYSNRLRQGARCGGDACLPGWPLRGSGGPVQEGRFRRP